MDIVLSPGSEKPIYNQIFSQISSQIVSGRLPAGSQLPTIRQIAAELRISVIPVKRAWEELARAGFITTQTGKGSFVVRLAENEISQKKTEKASILVQQLCRQAKEAGIKKQELISLIEKEYQS